MKQRLMSIGVGGTAASLILMSASAWAATSPPPRFGLTGKVTRVNLGSIVIQSGKSSITVKVTGSTIYTRVEAGKESDLKSGVFVTVVLNSSKQVARVNEGSRFGGFRRPPGSRPPGARPTRTRTGTRPGRFNGAGFQGGTITSIGKGKLTLRGFTGKSTTYTLAKSVTVTKTVAAAFKDIHPGMTIRVGAPPGSSTAFSITIE